MIKRLLALALCLGLFPASAFAQAPSPPLRFLDIDHLSVAVPQTPSAEWQREYDDAQNRRKAGMRKLLIGGAASAGGVVVMLMSTGSYVEGNGGAMNAGIIIGLAGGAIGTWGLFQYGDARQDIQALENRRLMGRGGFAMPLAENQALTFSLGQTKSLAYRLSW